MLSDSRSRSRGCPEPRTRPGIPSRLQYLRAPAGDRQRVPRTLSPARRSPWGGYSHKEMLRSRELRTVKPLYTTLRILGVAWAEAFHGEGAKFKRRWKSKKNSTTPRRRALMVFGLPFAPVGLVPVGPRLPLKKGERKAPPPHEMAF